MSDTGDILTRSVQSQEILRLFRASLPHLRCVFLTHTQGQGLEITHRVREAVLCSPNSTRWVILSIALNSDASYSAPREQERVKRLKNTPKSSPHHLLQRRHRHHPLARLQVPTYGKSRLGPGFKKSVPLHRWDNARDNAGSHSSKPPARVSILARSPTTEELPVGNHSSKPQTLEMQSKCISRLSSSISGMARDVRETRRCVFRTENGIRPYYSFPHRFRMAMG